MPTTGGFKQRNQCTWTRLGNNVCANLHQYHGFPVSENHSTRYSDSDLCDGNCNGGNGSTAFNECFCFPCLPIAGIFIPLIVTNCIVIGRAEAYASKNEVKFSAFDGFSMGLGMTFSLVVLGALREIIGNGTLFSGLDLLLGDWAKALRIDVLHIDSGLLLAILPPGAFIGLGVILAVKNIIDKR